MTPHRTLHARRRALRATLRARRKALRRRVRATRRRRARERDPGRLRRRLALASVVLLLLWLSRCTADAPLPPVSPGTFGQPHPPTAAAATTSTPLAPPLPTGAPLSTATRPAYAPTAAPAHPWLDDFRLQVAARSPRLAACFEGTSEPGALQWSAGVEPLSGTVVDSMVSPLSETAPLTRAEQDCVQDVLATPAYTLPAEPDRQGRSLPTRVRLLLEF